ncbi:MAG: sulfite exporter TauE/SafE family protein, partial [Actinobacteria bacterium]|nr:sulfite exporter TauE/SafE family protein [Actinomycetota bacterium]
VFVPALVYGAGWSIQEAVAASLVIIVFSALSGTLRSMRSEVPVDWKAAALFSSTAAPSTLIGVAASHYFSETLTQVVFAGFLLALAYPTARSGKRYRETVRGSTHPALTLVGGIGAGTLAGLIGIGGAVLTIPLLIFGFGLNPKTAISTSLVVTLLISIVGAAGYVAAGFDRFSGLPPLIVGSMIGAWPGVRIRERLGEAVLQRAFAAYMVVVAALIIIDAVVGS